MLNVIRQWVIKTMMKSKGETGIVKTIPKRDLVELNTQITAQRLMENGIDPMSLKNTNQVENAIIAMENKQKANLAENIRGGIGNTKTAKIMDMEGKEIDPRSKIMGGKQAETEAEILARIEEENKKGIEGLKQKMKKEQARSKRISGNLRESNRKRFDRIQFGEEKKGPPVKDVDYDYYRELLDSQGDEFSDDIAYVVGDETEDTLKAMVKEAEDEVAYMKKLYDKGALDPPEDMAQGGRAGFKTGLGKRFLDLLKGKPKKRFDEIRFREGPIDLDFLENIDKKDLEKFIRTRDTGGSGGYGMYDNFADMPAGLRAAELIKTIKGPRNEINYKAAELFLGKKLKGNETANELIQMLNRQEMRADGGRIGYDKGSKLTDFIDVQAEGTKSGKQQIKGAPEGITADRESINAIIKADIPISQKIDLLAKYQYGKGRTKIERDGQEIFLDEGGAKNRDIGFGFNKDGEGIGGTLMYNMETGEPEFNIGFKKSFADGGRIGLKAGMTKRAFLKLMGGTGAAIGALKSGIFSGFGKGAGKQAAKEVVQKSTSTPPPYFFELANKIKTLGRVTDGPQERIKIHSMPAKDGKSELMLTEDIGTGEMQIKKISKEGDDMVTEVQTMDYTPGSSQADETTKGIPADSYDEYTEFNSRIIKDEYNDPDIVEGIKVDEIIEEVKDQAPSIKKAGGGIARMLGE